MKGNKTESRVLTSVFSCSHCLICCFNSSMLLRISALSFSSTSALSFILSSSRSDNSCKNSCTFATAACAARSLTCSQEKTQSTLGKILHEDAAPAYFTVKQGAHPLARPKHGLL